MSVNTLVSVKFETI